MSNDGTESLIPVGGSDYGLTTPGGHSAITLVQIRIMFGSLFADYDVLLEERIMTDWIDTKGLAQNADILPAAVRIIPAFRLPLGIDE